MWAMFKKDPVLLSTCSAGHAGRVVLQLLASCSCNRMTARDALALAKDGGISKVWCGRCLRSPRVRPSILSLYCFAYLPTSGTMPAY